MINEARHLCVWLHKNMNQRKKVIWLVKSPKHDKKINGTENQCFITTSHKMHTKKCDRECHK